MLWPSCALVCSWGHRSAQHREPQVEKTMQRAGVEQVLLQFQFFGPKPVTILPLFFLPWFSAASLARAGPGPDEPPSPPKGGDGDRPARSPDS